VNIFDFNNPVLTLVILFFNIALCEYLVRKTFLKHVGTALLVILITAIEANLFLIPSASDPSVVYDAIFTYVAPISIFYLLLEVNFASIKKAGLPIILMFFIGSLGTVLGVFIAGNVVGGVENIGEKFPMIAGMFTGTYTGGSINFNAVALHYEMNKEANLYTGAVAIDNIITAIWMIATIALPKFLQSWMPRTKQVEDNKEALSEKDLNDTERLNPMNTSILIALGLVALMVSDWLAAISSIPSILILTTISLVLAQFKFIQYLDGSRVLGIIGIYLFLAVIGAYCELAALPKIGEIATYLLLFAFILVLVHGLVTFTLGYLFKVDWDIVAIASQANVGGSGSAIALARSLDRNDLLLPSILIGTVGNALGTYLGFMMVNFF